MPFRIIPEDGFTVHVARIFESGPENTRESEIETIINELASLQEKHARGAYLDPEIIELLQHFLSDRDLPTRAGLWRKIEGQWKLWPQSNQYTESWVSFLAGKEDLIWINLETSAMEDEFFSLVSFAVKTYGIR